MNNDIRFKKDVFVEKACGVNHFAFTLVMKDPQYDIVTNSYEDYRDITRGLQCLIDQRTNLQAIAKRIQIQNPVTSQFKVISEEEAHYSW